MAPPPLDPLRTSDGTLERGPFAYRIWESGQDWLWQVTREGVVVAEGAARTMIEARAEAIARAIRATEERESGNPQ